ncbi:MAG: substrate-binding domain-containing protein [Anaerolineae bacterium]
MAATPHPSSPAGIATGDTSTHGLLFLTLLPRIPFDREPSPLFKRQQPEAKATGLLADFTIVSANGDPAQQAGQIQTMISERYEAIIINPASPTALNQVIKSACAAGIVVVVFDSQVTEPCVYTVTYVWANYGAVQGNYVGGRLNGRGNVLEVRGAKEQHLRYRHQRCDQSSLAVSLM